MTTLEFVLEFFKRFKLSDFIATASAVFSLLALVVAVRVHRFAVTQAGEVGQLHSARIETNGRKNGRLYISLQAVNGRTEVTIIGLTLIAVFHTPPPATFKRGPLYEFRTYNEDAMQEFEIEGPDLDVHLSPHDRAVWLMPSRYELIDNDNYIEYRVRFYTARNEYVESSAFTLGHIRGVFPLAQEVRTIGIGATSLWTLDKSEYPKAVLKWAANGRSDGDQNSV